MNDRVLIEAFEDCLRAMEAGATMESALVRHPQLADELRPMLLAVQAVRPSQPLRVPKQSEEASHTRLLARARELRQQNRRSFALWPQLTLVARLALIVLVLAAGGLSVASASAQALPGEALYPVKRLLEQAQLNFADAATRAALEQHFEQRRLAETQAVVAQQREAEVEFTGLVQAVTDERWRIAGFTVQVRAGLAGDAGVGDMVKVWGRTQTDGVIVASRLEKRAEDGAPAPIPTAEPSATPPAPTQAPVMIETPPSPQRGTPTETNRPTAMPTTVTPTTGAVVSPLPSNTPLATPPAIFTPAPTTTDDDTETPEPEETEFEGVVQSTGGVWVIGGQAVVVNAQTEFRGNPQVGDTVKVKAYRLNDGTLLARRIEKKN